MANAFLCAAIAHQPFESAEQTRTN